MHEKFAEYVREGKPWVKVQFPELLAFDVDLADELLENPEEVVKAADMAIEKFDARGDVKDMHTRFFKLPKTCQRSPWHARKGDVGGFVALRGNINKASGIEHICEVARFECPVCALAINIVQKDKRMRKPTHCSCGNKKGFKLIDKTMTDNIRLGLMDDLMEMENKDKSIATEKSVILSKDLTVREIDRMIRPGRKVIVNGWFEYFQRGDSVQFDSIFKANSIEFLEVGWETVNISQAEEEQIRKLAKDSGIIERLANSIADVKGFSWVKIASLLLLAGAPHIYDKESQLSSRGTIHILLIGDPGGAKTYFAKRAGHISPIYYFQSASTASGKGLVAATQQDKEIGTWTVYPGVVAMCHKGVAVIDEIDKTHEEDYGDHNNAMNDMQVPIAKASVKAILDTETSYLATANPTDRVFSEYESYYKQINMPKDFVDRFDVIFPMIVPKEKDERDRIMDVMLERHLDSETTMSWKPEFSHDIIRKYISYCRRFNPKLKRELFRKIKSKVHELMRPKPGEEGQVKISFRQLESITRFAYAAARLRLTDVDEDAIDLAFELKRQSFKDLHIIDESGSFSWAKLEDIDEEVISNRERMTSILKELEKKVGKVIPVEDFSDLAKERGLEEDEIDKYIEKEKFIGNLMEVRRGFIQRM